MLLVKLTLHGSFASVNRSLVSCSTQRTLANRVHACLVVVCLTRTHLEGMWANEGHSARLKQYFEVYTRLRLSVIRIMLWAIYCLVTTSKARWVCNSKGRASWWPLRNLCVAASGPQRPGSSTFDLENRNHSSAHCMAGLLPWSPEACSTSLRGTSAPLNSVELLIEARAHLSARWNNRPC